MFKPTRATALLAVPGTLFALIAVLASGNPTLMLLLFPPAIQLPFFLAAQVTGSPRAIDAALISTRVTAVLMLGGGIVTALACASPPLLFVSFFGGCLLLGAGPGASEARLAGCVALTGVLAVVAGFAGAWFGLAGFIVPGLLMLLGGCAWALEAALSPRPATDTQLPRACARFCR